MLKKEFNFNEYDAGKTKQFSEALIRDLSKVHRYVALFDSELNKDGKIFYLVSEDQSILDEVKEKYQMQDTDREQINMEKIGLLFGNSEFKSMINQ